MKEISCPKCRSSRMEFLTGAFCRCKECETIFKLEEEDIASDVEENKDNTKDTPQTVVYEDNRPKTRKCSYCGWEVPEGVEVCPNCGGRTWSRFFKDVFGGLGIFIALITAAILILYVIVLYYG